jgi:hypothetical protein
MKMGGVKLKTESKVSPFDFLKSINDTKVNLIDQDETNAKYYNSYIVNRSLSYFPDTVAIANEMNRLHHLDEKLQNDFLINIVRKRKRFSKWDKSTDSESLGAIKEYYGYSNDKARHALAILTQDEITTITKKVYKGGRE